MAYHDNKGSRMKLPVHVQFLGMEPSAALEASVHEHARKLESFADDLIACRVAIALEQKHQRQGRPYSIRIDLTLPGSELVVDKAQHEDAYVALREAFDALRRQLEETVRKRRGQVKQHATPAVKLEPPDNPGAD
jgi:ribosomal subunit interface protein